MTRSRTFEDRVAMLTALSEPEASDALRSLAYVLRSMQRVGIGQMITSDNIATYLIGSEQDKYITRTLLPRVDDCRMLIHTIHRDDLDRHPHDHPWDEAVFLVVDGGYTDERWIRTVMMTPTYLQGNQDQPEMWMRDRRVLRPGDLNTLTASDYHRAVDVLPDTLTLGVVGRRVQEWGFMVDGVKVPNEQYRSANSGYVRRGGLT